VDGAGGDVYRVASPDDVLLVAEADDVLAVEHVLLVFDLVGVLRHLRARVEREPPERERWRAVLGTEQDRLREAGCGIDRLGVDLDGAAHASAVR